MFPAEKKTIDSNVDLSRKGSVLNTSIRRVLILHLMFTFNLVFISRGRRARDRMVVEFTTTCAINAYHH